MEMSEMVKDVIKSMETINFVESKQYRMENWSTSMAFQYQSLQGNVYGHEDFMDGTYIIACVISSVSEDGVVTTIRGAEYVLGEVDPDYEAEYTNAKERLIEAWEGI